MVIEIYADPGLTNKISTVEIPQGVPFQGAVPRNGGVKIRTKLPIVYKLKNPNPHPIDVPIEMHDANPPGSTMMSFSYDPNAMTNGSIAPSTGGGDLPFILIHGKECYGSIYPDIGYVFDSYVNIEIHNKQNLVPGDIEISL